MEQASDPVGASTGAGRGPSVPLAVAAFASLGAGAVHAAAIGGHSGLDQVVAAFTASAAFQLGWGALALAVPRRPVIALGAVGNLALLGGWVLAKTSGIGFVDGFEEAQSPARADTTAAVLAAVAVLGAAVALARPGLARRWAPGAMAGAGTVALLVGVTGMAAAADPNHHGGDGAAGHSHGEATAAPHDDGHADDHGDGDDHHAEATPAVARPYDPALPIDLGGVEGVTPAQQAAAENLIANTLSHLPAYADPAVAEAAGYASINDGGTGYEHYINDEYRTDGRVLDPDRPESLVYQIVDGQKTLVAAMYMAEPGTTLDTVPELGGPLTQWHIHDNLCFTPPPRSVVAGLTNADGTCRPGLVKPEPVPMIHVWIRSHECGPFAALEGVAGGQIPEGEERLCDHAHGH